MKCGGDVLDSKVKTFGAYVRGGYDIASVDEPLDSADFGSDFGSDFPNAGGSHNTKLGKLNIGGELGVRLGKVWQNGNLRQGLHLDAAFDFHFYNTGRSTAKLYRTVADVGPLYRLQLQSGWTFGVGAGIFIGTVRSAGGDPDGQVMTAHGPSDLDYTSFGPQLQAVLRFPIPLEAALRYKYEAGSKSIGPRETDAPDAVSDSISMPNHSAILMLGLPLELAGGG